MYKYPFEILLSILLSTCPEVQLLEYTAIPFLIFLGIAIVFLTMAALFYIPINRVQGFRFLHILSNTCYCFFFLLVARRDFLVVPMTKTYYSDRVKDTQLDYKEKTQVESGRIHAQVLSGFRLPTR